MPASTMPTCSHHTWSTFSPSRASALTTCTSRKRSESCGARTVYARRKRGASSMYCCSFSSNESSPSSRCSRCWPMPDVGFCRNRALIPILMSLSSRHGAVHAQQLFGGARPGVLRRALQPLLDEPRSHVNVHQRQLQGACEPVDVVWIYQQRGPLGDLG